MALILAISPVFAFHRVRSRRDELQHQLDEISDARPRMKLVGVENVPTRMHDVTTGALLGTPVFSRVNFANSPAPHALAVDAINVVGHIDVYGQDSTHICGTVGRWSETREEASGGLLTEMEQILIPPNARPAPLDIVLKYPEDEGCYVHSNSGRRLAPSDWRDGTKLIPKGTFFVKVHLRGNNVDTEFWMRFINGGAGTDVALETLDAAPRICLG